MIVRSRIFASAFACGALLPAILAGLALAVQLPPEVVDEATDASCAAGDPTGSCAAGDAAACVDDHASCADWSERGECARNPGYMLTSCRRSCMACVGAAPTEE